MMDALALDSSLGCPVTTTGSRRLWGQPVHDVLPPAPDDDTSFQLLLRARAGEPDARERLCERYLPRLRRWAQGRLPRGARGMLDTGDLVQEVMLHALARLHQFEPRHEWSFPAYLRQALLHRICDEARRVNREPVRDPLGSDHVTSEPSPLEHAIGVEAVARYEAALARLREEDQVLIVARCEWGLSHKELAELVGKPTPAAAQVAVYRAMVQLAKEMSLGH